MSATEGDPLRLEVELSDQTDQASDHLALVSDSARRTVALEGLVGAYQLSISIVSDEQIQRLNRQHRGVDRVTDVLSFPLVDDSAGFILPSGSPTHLGDVVIAFDQAARQSAEYGHSLERELAYLSVHGVLHLLGYDHDELEAQVQMRSREEEVLADLPR